MRPADLLQLQQNIGQALAVLKGDFADEIKKYTEAKEKWDERKKLDEEVEKLAIAQREVVTNQTLVDEQAAEWQKKLNAQKDALALREKKLEEREKDAVTKDNALTDKANELDAARSELEQQRQTLQAEFDQKLADAQRTLDDANARSDEFAKREQKVKAAMAAMASS